MSERISVTDRVIDQIVERTAQRVTDRLRGTLAALIRDLHTPDLKPPYGVEDLMKVTGKGRDVVREEMRNGNLPGYVVGRSYVCPHDAFHAFCAGQWRPQAAMDAARPSNVVDLAS